MESLLISKKYTTAAGPSTQPPKDAIRAAWLRLGAGIKLPGTDPDAGMSYRPGMTLFEFAAANGVPAGVLR